MSGRVTMQDIADSLGLSRNTVSKAFNNTGVIAESTKDLILRNDRIRQERDCHAYLLYTGRLALCGDYD